MRSEAYFWRTPQRACPGESRGGMKPERCIRAFYEAVVNNCLDKEAATIIYINRLLGVSCWTEMPVFWQPFTDLIRVMPA